MPRRQLQQAMTSADFAEEVAYYNIEPWGDEWERTSLLASMYYNANKPRFAKYVEHDHFVPKKRVAKHQSPQEIMWRLDMHMRAYQAKRELMKKRTANG